MTEIKTDRGTLTLGDSAGEAIGKAWHHMLDFGYGIVLMRRQNNIHIRKEHYAEFAKWLKDFDEFTKTHQVAKGEDTPILEIGGVQYKWNDKDEYGRP
jgi:hypothetical protein